MYSKAQLHKPLPHVILGTITSRPALRQQFQFLGMLDMLHTFTAKRMIDIWVGRYICPSHSGVSKDRPSSLFGQRVCFMVILLYTDVGSSEIDRAS